MRGLTLYGHLKRQVWRLQAFLTVLVGILAVVPPVIFLVLQVSHVRDHGNYQAAHIAVIIRMLVEERRMDVGDLSPLLEHEVGPAGMLSVHLLGAGGKEILRVGEPMPFLWPIEIALPLTPPVGSLRELRFTVDDRLFFYPFLRVVGIHFLVAAILAAAIYKMGVQSLRQAVEELESIQAQLIHSEKLSAIGEIYAGITHEINNPLGIILSRVKLLLGDKERRIPAELLPDLEMIHRHGSRIAEIIRGLLAFARRTSLDMTETDLNRVINEAVSLVEKPFSKSEVRIECQLSNVLPPILGSSAHLQQVLVNLLNNARDAMPQGGTINVRTWRNHLYVVAEVQDSGIGIAEDIQGRIFDPFFTTKRVGSGTGLGLSVSYGIMKAHGGDIEVESTAGKGALFRLLLPVDQRAT